MCILTLERHQIKNPSKLAAFRNFNTEKISNFRTYKMRGESLLNCFSLPENGTFFVQKTGIMNLFLISSWG